MSAGLRDSACVMICVTSSAGGCGERKWGSPCTMNGHTHVSEHNGCTAGVGGASHTHFRRPSLLDALAQMTTGDRRFHGRRQSQAVEGFSVSGSRQLGRRRGVRRVEEWVTLQPTGAAAPRPTEAAAKVVPEHQTSHTTSLLGAGASRKPDPIARCVAFGLPRGESNRCCQQMNGRDQSAGSDPRVWRTGSRLQS
jgi:hypothetical protein